MLNRTSVQYSFDSPIDTPNDTLAAPINGVRMHGSDGVGLWELVNLVEFAIVRV